MTKKLHDSRMTIFLATAVIAFITLACLSYVFVPTKSSVKSSDVEARLQALEDKNSEFDNWEKQTSFAGNKTIWEVSGTDTYFAFETLGSGLPIAHAKCFKVDKNNAISEVGEFPKEGTTTVFEDIDPKTCDGIN